MTWTQSSLLQNTSNHHPTPVSVTPPDCKCSQSGTHLHKTPPQTPPDCKCGQSGTHLHSGLVSSQNLVWLLRVLGIPDADQIVVGSTCEVLSVCRPFHSTHLKMVVLRLCHTVFRLAYIMIVNGTISTTTAIISEETHPSFKVIFFKGRYNSQKLLLSAAL